jgi:hypothetical protein
MRYNHLTNFNANNLFMDAQSIALAGNPAGAILRTEMNLARSPSDYQTPATTLDRKGPRWSS